MKASTLYAFILVGFFSASGQAPVINAVSPLSTYPSNKVIITGSGFSATSSQLQVWFNHVRGTITASSELAIEVDVPPSAKYGVLEVVNLATRLSARSSFKFSPYYSGSSFSAALLSAPLTFTGSNEFFDLCSCDLNGDNKPEVVATRLDVQTDLIVLQNQSTVGNLAFTQLDKSNLPSLDVGAPTEKVTCGDLNGDGKPELIATRNGSTKNVVFVLPNTSPGAISFGPVVSLFLDVGHFARFVKIRDVNGDGKPDIIVSNSFNNQLYIFQNQSAGGVLSINPVPIKVSVAGATTTFGLDVQDIDNDGRADLIVNQFQANSIFILKNESTSSISFAPAISISAFGTLNTVTTADINNDEKLDLIVTNTFGNQVLVLLNTSTPGSISFNTTIALPTSNGPWGVDVGDIDGDQDIDIVVANRNQSQINVFKHDGDNVNVTFTKSDFIPSNPTRNILMGDLDGDAKPDIAFSSFNATTSTYKIELMRNKNCYSPVILNQEPIAICAGQTIRLNLPPGIGVTSYDWMESGVSIGVTTDPFFDITTPGNYEVSATSEGGTCVVNSSILTVSTGAGSIPADPVITTNAPVCTGQPLQLGTTSVGVLYEWNGPNGFTSTVQNPSIAAVDKSNAGLYSLSVSNGTCKSNVITERIDVADLESFSISAVSNIICSGNTTILSISAVAGHQYQWIKDNVDIIGQTGTTLSVSQEGTYKARVQNISLGCTVETNSIFVTVLTAPVANFSMNATSCSGADVLFTDQSSVDIRATLVYAWTFGDGAASSAPSPTHAYVIAQNFSPSLTLTYAGVPGCSSTLSKSLTVVAATVPVISASSPSSCPGEAIDLSLAGNFSTINWSTGETTNAIVVLQPGVYTVSTQDQNGCIGNGTIEILSKPLPTLAIMAGQTSIVTGQSVQLEATGADSYTWEPTENLSDPLIANPIATPEQTTSYTVTGQINNGCSAQESITITVNNELAALNVPNIFSPNGDGINDLWVIPGIEAFSDCTLSIFDKTGSRIFEQKGYANNWDGTLNGNKLPEGTYFYIFNCIDRQPFTGHLLVAR